MRQVNVREAKAVLPEPVAAALRGAESRDGRWCARRLCRWGCIGAALL